MRSISLCVPFSGVKFVFIGLRYQAGEADEDSGGGGGSSAGGALFLDELHLLIVTFLKKLSIFEENKAEMVSAAVPRRHALSR